MMAPPPHVMAPPPAGAAAPGFTPPPPPRNPGGKRPWWRRGFVVAPASFLIGLTIGGGAAAGGEAAVTAAKPATTITVTAPAAEPAAAEKTTAPPPADDYTPKPADFRVSLSVTEKQCFGSAGCNITYRIKPEYVGTNPVPEGKTYTITYQVDGGEDGPKINSFTLENGTATYDQEELVSVKSAKAKLSAKVTSVLED